MTGSPARGRLCSIDPLPLTPASPAKNKDPHMTSEIASVTNEERVFVYLSQALCESQLERLSDLKCNGAFELSRARRSPSDSRQSLCLFIVCRRHRLHLLLLLPHGHMLRRDIINIFPARALALSWNPDEYEFLMVPSSLLPPSLPVPRLPARSCVSRN